MLSSLAGRSDARSRSWSRPGSGGPQPHDVLGQADAEERKDTERARRDTGCCARSYTLGTQAAGIYLPAHRSECRPVTFRLTIPWSAALPVS